MDDMECDAEYTVREIYTEIRDNLDGEPRMIGAEVVVGVSISGYMISEPQAIYRRILYGWQHSYSRVQRNSSRTAY